MDLLWTNSTAGQGLKSNRLNDRQTSKLFTEFPGHRKCRPNVPRIFDVCSELKSDCKSYFGFLVDKFSEAVKTEITTFSTMISCSRLLRDQTAGHGLK